MWLGSAPGAAVSWSDTQIVATVASNAMSGTARVRQLGAWSNAVPFNVNTATIATVTPASGGVIATADYVSATIFDQNGNATGQMANMPTYSWTEEVYTTGGGQISDVVLPPIELGTSYEATAGGNLSSNGTSIGVSEMVEGHPVFALSVWSPSCRLAGWNGEPSKKVALTGEALDRYNQKRNDLLQGNYLTSQDCTEFLSLDGFWAGYFPQFTSAVERQIPWDGIQTNISLYDAGMVSPSDSGDEKKIGIFKKAPVCGQFVNWKGPNGTTVVESKTHAYSQIGGTARDVYLNPKLFKEYSQGMVLHEALPNLTGLYDFGVVKLDEGLSLAKALGLTPSVNCTDGTMCITRRLLSKGCAGTQ